MSDKTVSGGEKVSNKTTRLSSDRQYLLINFLMGFIYVLFTFMPDDEIDMVALLVVKYMLVLLSSIYIIGKLFEDGLHSFVDYLDCCNNSMFKRLSLASKLSLVGFGLWFIAILFKKVQLYY